MNITQEPHKVYDVGSEDQAFRLIYALKREGFLARDAKTKEVVGLLQGIPTHQSAEYTIDDAKAVLCQSTFKEKIAGCSR